MIRHPEVLRLAGYLLDPVYRRTSGFLAEDISLKSCPVGDPLACRWSIDGAVIRCAVALSKPGGLTRALECLADLGVLFGTKNYASHWDGSLACPRWTQDGMVEMLKGI